MKDVFYEEIPALAGVLGVQPVIIYQGITHLELEKMAQTVVTPSA